MNSKLGVSSQIKPSSCLSDQERREAWGVYVRRTHYLTIDESVSYKSYRDDGLTFEQFCKMYSENNIY